MTESTLMSGPGLALRRLWTRSARMRRWVLITAWWLLLSYELVRVAAWAIRYDEIPPYSLSTAHRVTAISMLNGSLHYPVHLPAGADHDLQVYNGAVYTNWGFGVPLLRLPFYAREERSAREKGDAPPKDFPIVPDQKVLLTYVALTVALALLAWRRLLARLLRMGVHTSSMTAGVMVLGMMAHGLLMVMSTRFLVYEETVAYQLLANMGAAAAFMMVASRSRRWRFHSVLGGLMASLALLIRPTGLVHLAVWGFSFAMSRRRLINLPFALGALPLTLAWLWGNKIRSGGWLSIGMQNSFPGYFEQIEPVRFGVWCQEAWGWRQPASAVWGMLYGGNLDARDGLYSCGFGVETLGVERVPLLGYPVLLLVLGGGAWALLAHGRKLRRQGPLVAALALVALTCFYLFWGLGFASRYQGDFWPLTWVAGLETLRLLAAPIRRALRRPSRRLFMAAAVLLLGGAFSLTVKADVNRQRKTLLTATEKEALESMRTYIPRNEAPLQMPLRRNCHGPRGYGAHDGGGWKADCSVERLVNMMVRVPPSANPHRVLVARVANTSPLQPRFYINGRVYEARGEGGDYVADFTLDSADLYAPVILVSIQWDKPPQVPALRLKQVFISEAGNPPPLEGKGAPYELRGDEMMATTGVRDGEHGWNLDSMGMLSGLLAVEQEAHYRLVARMKGTPALGSPAYAEIQWDGMILTQTGVMQQEYQDMAWDLGRVHCGSHELSIRFTNDLFNGSEDRNLYVESVRLEAVP